MTTIKDIKAWAKGAPSAALEQVADGISAELEARRRQPVTDSRGRRWKTQDAAVCAMNGCRGCARCMTPPAFPTSGW